MDRRSLLELQDPSELTVDNYGQYGMISIVEFEHFMNFFDALWFDQSIPEKHNVANKPHALLTSGKHSNGFIDLGRVFKESEPFRMLMARNLYLKYQSWHLPVTPAWVVGSDTSATKLAGDVACLLGARHAVLRKGADKKQHWSADNRDCAVAGETFLQVEELVSTSSSALAARVGVLLGNPHLREIDWCGYAFVVVDRSSPDDPVDVIGNSRLVALFRYPIINWEAKNCPWCRAGSVAIEPKKDDNWAKLTANR